MVQLNQFGVGGPKITNRPKPAKWEIMCFVKQLPQRLVYCEKKSKSCGSVIKIPQLVVLSDIIPCLHNITWRKDQHTLSWLYNITPVKSAQSSLSLSLSPSLPPPLPLPPSPLSLSLSLSPYPLSKRLDTEQKEKKKEYREEERKNNTYQTSLGFSSSWAEELFQGIPSGSEQIHTEKHFLNFPSFFFCSGII